VVHLARVGEGARGFIEEERAGLPGVPEGFDGAHPLIRHQVALIVLEVLLVAVVLGRSVGRGGDEVDADPAVGEVVEGVEQARRQKRRIKRRGRGGDDAELGGSFGQQRDERHRVHADDAGPQRLIERAAVGVGDDRRVLHHHVVETGALQ
jgi:hypothetical protein